MNALAIALLCALPAVPQPRPSATIDWHQLVGVKVKPAPKKPLYPGCARDLFHERFFSEPVCKPAWSQR